MPIAEILALIDAGVQIFAIAEKQINLARERGEWTAEQDAEFAARFKAVTAQPHWQPQGTPTAQPGTDNAR